MTVDLTAFLRSLNVDASILPAAPAEDVGRCITRRTQDEAHDCLVCGRRAGVAYVVTTDTGNRWLDLCPNHASDVRKANELPAPEGFGPFDTP